MVVTYDGALGGEWIQWVGGGALCFEILLTGSFLYTSSFLFLALLLPPAPPRTHTPDAAAMYANGRDLKDPYLSPGDGDGRGREKSLGSAGARSK